MVQDRLLRLATSTIIISEAMTRRFAYSPNHTLASKASPVAPNSPAARHANPHDRRVKPSSIPLIIRRCLNRPVPLVCWPIATESRPFALLVLLALKESVEVRLIECRLVPDALVHVSIQILDCAPRAFDLFHGCAYTTVDKTDGDGGPHLHLLLIDA